MTHQVEHEIPEKTELTKLKVKHAVLDDTKALEKAIVDFHAALEKKPSLVEAAHPINVLAEAYKKTSTALKSKHPKFVASLQREFGEPLDKLVEKCKSIATLPDTMRKFRVQAYLDCNTMEEILAQPLTETAVKQLLEKGTGFGQISGNLADAAHQMRSAGDTNPLWTEIFDGVQANKDAWKDVDRVLQAMLKSGNYSVDTAPFRKKIEEIKTRLIKWKSSLTF